jgi:hypothetical protein
MATAKELIDLSVVGCQPVVSSSELQWGVMGESDYSDGWSSARTTGWSPTRVHRVSWRVMNSASVRALRLQLDAAQDNFSNVFIEVIGQDPIIGRVMSQPTITRQNAAIWSAEVTIEENR